MTRIFSWTQHQLNKASEVKSVIDDLEDYLPLTLRQIFYRLVAAFKISNTRSQYNMLSTLVSEMRHEGMALMSGARQGELLGLKWGDVDWKSSQIRIQRTFNNLAWYETKTKASNRRIDLGPAMMTELKKWRLACPHSELDLVFPNEAGQPLNHNNMVGRYFMPALRAAGIDKIRFHDLRHTYASLMIEQGENIKYIQTQLGHSSPTVTLNVYAHLMKATNQEAPSRLEDTILKNFGSKMVAEKDQGATVLTVTP